MKRKNLYILALVFCFALAGICFNFLTANAQTNNKTSQTPTPKPSVSATPPKIASPTAEPTPEEDNEKLVIETEIVGLNVRVIDRNNRPINNLQKDEFKVYEDNVLQQ
ncbi:MAG: hypothetical protein ABWZ66_10180, partial [Pyrinomonadaceae bacterium]